MNNEMSYGRRLMEMATDENFNVEFGIRGEVETTFSVPEKVDMAAQWNQISKAIGFPTMEEDLSDALVRLEVVITQARPSINKSMGECEMRPFPMPSTVSHAQREPSEWAKKFVWGNNSQPLPKKESTARVWRERKPVPVLDNVEFGNEFFLDDVRSAYAEAMGVDCQEIYIDVPDVIYV